MLFRSKRSYYLFRRRLYTNPHGDSVNCCQFIKLLSGIQFHSRKLGIKFLFWYQNHRGSTIDNMTIYGHHMTMKANQEDSVRIAEFKAQLSHHLRKVRQGHSLTLLDRNTPIAKVLPYSSEPGRLRTRKPTREVKDVRLPPPLSKKINSLIALTEERQRER